MACCNKRGGCQNACQQQKQKQTCNDCRTCAVNGCQGGKQCEWYPIEETCEDATPMRVCCDQNGCCGLFPEECRNKFWPDFSHPRWLCCRDLYCARQHRCG